jgi:hypothetical protein
MAGLERLVSTDQLKTTLLAEMVRGEREGQAYTRYNSVFDALMILVVPPDTATVVHYLNDHMALLYRPDDYEIVGEQIEAFEHSYLPANTRLEQSWQEVRPLYLQQWFDLTSIAPRIAQAIARLTGDPIEVVEYALRRSA